MGLLTMSNHLMVALIAFVMMVDLVNAETRCPARCLCFRSTVRCMFLQLDQVPAVPANTTILYLYKNRIKDIDKHTFHDLPKLEQLYLHFNQIDHLDPETFSNVPSLERLFLHNNKLQRIPSGAFHNMESLKRLRLDSNALICDCQILWLAKMLNEKQGTTQAAAICQSPDQLNGRSVTSLIEEFNCKKPVLTEEPTDVEITFGGTVYFTCKAEGDPEPDIVWLYNNNEISPDDDPKYQVLQDGTLMIENASDSDMGSYECMAKSPAGEVKSRSVHMKPILANSHSNHNSTKVKPKFVVTPEDVDVQDGSSARLDCEVTGLPRPVITWTFNDGPVDRQRTGMSLPTDVFFFLF
ncbi:putative Leucine-rich repeat-containing protein 3 [Daphnia magna]|uniref:Putative Leucine-rich repeat-containing protein 3 n=1 Tax=Daphnia magna TaxID=35525 RepID=A0A162NKV7_9CRUS|nr:putative Leucine-rich repeat-containing protein 3 [Daphnia magna]